MTDNPFLYILLIFIVLIIFLAYMPVKCKEDDTDPDLSENAEEPNLSASVSRPAVSGPFVPSKYITPKLASSLALLEPTMYFSTVSRTSFSPCSLPLAKVSISCADGNFRIRAVSWEAINSELTVRARPNSSLIILFHQIRAFLLCFRERPLFLYCLNHSNSSSTIDASAARCSSRNFQYLALSLASWSRRAVARMRQPVTDSNPFQLQVHRPSRWTMPLRGEPV